MHAVYLVIVAMWCINLDCTCMNWKQYVLFASTLDMHLRTPNVKLITVIQFMCLYNAYLCVCVAHE